MTRTPQRVIVYIDGFNFYYGLKSHNWTKYYWLDCVSLFQKFIRTHQQLVELNYFSAKPKDQGKSQRQEAFFSGNKSNPLFHLHLGKFLKKVITCRKCSHVYHTYEEKQTDVDIAVKMIGDVVHDRCDISILVSADSDLIPPINFIRGHKVNHKIFVYFPPQRFSYELTNKADRIVKLENHEGRFANSLLPDPVTLASGIQLPKPAIWP